MTPWHGYLAGCLFALLVWGIVNWRSMMDMQPWQHRVVQEKIELDSKIEKLEAFMQSPEFMFKVGLQEKSRLTTQRNAMVDYSAALGERIAAFSALTTA